MLKSGICNYSDTYILEKETITIAGDGNNDAAKRTDKRDKGVIFKNKASFTDCISEINNTQINNVKYLDIVVPMSNLKEHSKTRTKQFKNK